MATDANKFKVGDAVSLNTGGPVMSVRSAPTALTASYGCQWFAGKKLDSGHFLEEQLVAAQVKAPLPAPTDEKK